MWLYTKPGTPVHFVEVTPDNKYLFQAQIVGSQLGIDIFPGNGTTNSFLTLKPGSIHYRADISAMLPLPAYSDLVIAGEQPVHNQRAHSCILMEPC